jgi:Leucine-rich repeat
MEEKFKVRPCTPRVIEKKNEDLSLIQTPEEILASITGLNPMSFGNLLKLELKIDCDEHEIHKFGYVCPNVKELKLSGSSIESIRNLGTDWRNLEILWLVRVGLLEIDGISAFPKLKELYSAFNSITSLSALMFHENLQVLDMEGNKIESWDEIEYLRDCKNLWSINLEGNPITKALDYREKVFLILNSLTILDDINKENPIEGNDENIEIEIIHNSVRESAVARNKSESNRPSSAKNIFLDQTSRLTEEVFSGNPLKAMRFRRRKLYLGDGSDDIMTLIREFKFDDTKALKFDETKSLKFDETKSLKVDEAKSLKVDETKSLKFDETKSLNLNETKPLKLDETKNFKMDDKNFKLPARNFPVKARNIVIRTVRRDEFYDTN